MSTTTLAVLRQRLSETIGDYITGTATGGSTTTVVDTSLAKQPMANEDDAFVGWWVLILNDVVGNLATGDIRLITDSDASSTNVTVTQEFSAAIAVNDTYELHRYHPTEKLAAINRAARKAYPELHLPLINETLLSDNLVQNSGMETDPLPGSGWTHTVSTWSQASTATGDAVWHGTYSAKGVGGGAAAQMEQNIYDTRLAIHEIVGKTIHITARIWATDAASARIRVSFDGSTYTDSSYHSGGGEWEGPGTIYIDTAIPNDPTEISIWCEVAAGKTAFFDQVQASIDSVYRYTVPTAFAEPPSQVEIQVDENRPTGPFVPVTGAYFERNGASTYLRVDEPLPRGRVIRLEGKGYLSSVSADTDTMEVSGAQADLIAELAAAELFSALADSASSEGGEYFQALAIKHQQMANGLRATAGVRILRGARLRYRFVR